MVALRSGKLRSERNTVSDSPLLLLEAPSGAFFCAIKTATYQTYITFKNVLNYIHDYEEELTLIFVTLFGFIGNICRISK